MKKQVTVKYKDGEFTEKLLLKAYAPGDGALAMNCVRPSDPTGNVAPFKASEKDIQNLRNKHFPDYGLLKVGDKHPQYRLYRPVERVSENELKIEGKVYRYEPEFDKPDINPDVQRYKVFGSVKFGEDAPSEIEVKNLSTIGAVNFYVKNEDAILESKKEFNNESAFELSLSGKGRAQRLEGFSP